MKFASIQVLRAIAATSVVLLHVVMVFEKRLHLDVDSVALLKYGNIGVDIFFIISGFIMANIAVKLAERADALPFMIDRVFRIYPVYWLYASVALAIYLLRPDMVNSSSGSSPDILASYLLYPSDKTPILMVGWTLIYEMMFYFVIFARLLLFPKLAIGWLAGAWALLIGFNILVPLGNDVFLQTLLSPLVVEFLMGISLALLPTKFFDRRGGLGAIVLAVFFFLCVTIQIDPRVIEADQLKRVVLFGIPSLFMFYGLVSYEGLFEQRLLKGLVFVGDTSYSLYLSHIFVINGLVQVLLRLPIELNAILSVGFAVSILVASVIWAAISYHWIELPISRRLSKFKRRVFAY